MTEIERIINSGRIDKDFLKPETRCDFYVDEKRKKIWAVELDLLLELDRVCKKHGLGYFMAGGSLIGVIRHSGFIPWDDDVDVFMMREDYDRLMQIGPDEFRHPYFLQTPYTDKGCYFSFAKLRNSNTSAISIDFKYEEFNQGLFLDIFPLDNCMLEGLEERYNRINDLNMDCSTYMRMSDPDPNEVNKLRIQNYSGRDPMEVYEEIQRLATRDNAIATENISLLVNTISKYNEDVYKRTLFDGIIYKDFEGFSFPVPVGYEEILTTRYGDYMELPPVESRGQWHAKVVMEPDVPYKEFIKTLRK